MAMKKILPLLLCCIHLCSFAQGDAYKDSLLVFRQRYISEHGVVKAAEQYRLQFFSINPAYQVPVRVQLIEEAPWFKMETSGPLKKTYRVYAVLHFTLHDTAVALQVYQSKDLMASAAYADYLFIPFTDKTSGDESYDNGRYIDIRSGELNSPGFQLDFNKAYNPYCAYITGVYNCPVPPKENNLPLAIRAGEKKFAEAR